MNWHLKSLQGDSNSDNTTYKSSSITWFGIERITYLELEFSYLCLDHVLKEFFQTMTIFGDRVKWNEFNLVFDSQISFWINIARQGKARQCYNNSKSCALFLLLVRAIVIYIFLLLKESIMFNWSIPLLEFFEVGFFKVNVMSLTPNQATSLN